MAINIRNDCLKHGKSFNEETTLTGKTILKTIDKAKKLGYELQYSMLELIVLKQQKKE